MNSAHMLLYSSQYIPLLVARERRAARPFSHKSIPHLDKIFHEQTILADPSGRSTWVCDLSLAGIAGSIIAGAWNCLSFECCMLLGRAVGDGPVTRSSVPFISVSLYFLVLCLIVPVIHFVTFCKQIQTEFLQVEVRYKNCDC